MSKKRTSIKGNSPLTGLISEPELVEDEVKPSGSHAVKRSSRRSDEIQQETLYLHPDQVIDLEELVLQMKRRRPRIKTSKSGLARIAVDLLLEKDEDEIADLLS